jgi:hypothetical protein
MAPPGDRGPAAADWPVRLKAGVLEAVFLPGRGMLGISLRHRGDELLRRLEDLEAAAAKGSTAGLPLLHPFANRLAATHYRAAGREVDLDPASTLVHLDEHRLPIHGVPWARLAWEVVEAAPDRLVAGLDWNRADLLAVFPFPHRLELVATLRPDTLTMETTLTGLRTERQGVHRARADDRSDQCAHHRTGPSPGRAGRPLWRRVPDPRPAVPLTPLHRARRVEGHAALAQRTPDALRMPAPALEEPCPRRRRSSRWWVRPVPRVEGWPAPSSTTRRAGSPYGR